MVRLRVKSGKHTKGGVKYSPGEEFDGTLSELNAFSDKLELVESAQVEESEVEESSEEEEVDDSQLKVSIPYGGKGKRRGRPRGSRNKSAGRTDSNVD